MRKQILKIASGLGLCLMVSGCGIRDTTFYIPVDNQKGDAKPLSKDDVIRVVITHNYLNVLPLKESGWTQEGCFTAARDLTTKSLQELGYNVVDTGYHPKNDGHPTVIALVDSSPIEGSSRSETRTWDVPVFTDNMGRTTMSEKQGITITHRTYYYKVKLVRPEGEDNSLFKCNNNSYGLTDLCIAPANPSNYKTIFSSYATLSTDNPNFFGNLAYLTGAVFHRYPNPNMLGKRWVYTNNVTYDPLCAVEPNTPYPTKGNYEACVVEPNVAVMYRGKQL